MKRETNSLEADDTIRFKKQLDSYMGNKDAHPWRCTSIRGADP